MTLKEKLMAAIKPYLANDEKPEEVEKKVDEVIKDEATQAEKDNESEAERLKREERELKEREERENKDRKRDRAEDEDDKDKKAEDEEADKKEKEKMANDSRLAMDAAVKGVEKRFVELRKAEREVRPIVGELACDSAEEVYRTALKQMGCEDHATLPAATLSAVFKAYSRPVMAQDSAPIAASSRENVLNFFEGK